MLNPFTEVNWKPDHSERRKFAFSLIVGFPILALLFLVAGRLRTGGWDPTIPIRLGVGGAGLGAILWLLPEIARPFYVVWYGFACCMGLVIGNVLLSLFFYVVVSGIGLMLRVTGRDPLRKAFDKSASTYWTDVPKKTDPKRYYQQF